MRKIILQLILILSFLPIISFTQAKSGEYQLLEPLPCISGVGDCTVGSTISSINFNQYISYAFKFAIALSVFLAIIMIMIGGFEYMTSEIPGAKSDGKGKIKSAITGLLLVLSSYLILKTIDPRLVDVNTQLPRVEIKREDLDTVRAFNDKLSQDLKNMTIEKRNAVVDEEKKRIELESEMYKIQEQLFSIDSSADGYLLEKENLETKLAQIKSEITKNEVNQAKLIAEGSGVSSYRLAYESIKEPDQANNGVVEEQKQKIFKVFNDKIGTISSKDPETSQLLEKQRDFYIKEIDNEVQLKKDLDTLRMDDATSVKIEENLNKNLEVLLKKEKQYKSDLIDDKKIKSSGVEIKTYSEIFQNRINGVVKTRKDLISKSKKAATQLNEQEVNVPGI